MRLLIALAFSLVATVANAATYYVATTGNDTTGDGSSGNPWASINKAASMVSAGDTVLVRPGVYKQGSGLYNVYVNVSGTSGNPITFKSLAKWGAIIDGSGGYNYAFGFGTNASYITIQDFDITGQYAANQSTGASAVNVNQGTQTGITITGNRIHDIGLPCNVVPYGQTGVYATGAVNLTITNNVFENIGRNGPTEQPSCWPAYSDGASYAAGAQVSHGGNYYYASSACNSCANTPPAAPWTADTSFKLHDHALYFGTITNVTVKGNVFHLIRHGWPLHLFGGTATGLVFSRNIVSGQNVYMWQSGHIIFSENVSDSVIEGNVFSGPAYDMVFYYSPSGTFTNVQFRNNIMWPSTVVPGAPAGVTVSGNLNVDPGTHLPATMVR